MTRLEFKWAQGRPELWQGVRRVAVLDEANADLDALRNWLDRANAAMGALYGDSPTEDAAAERLDEIDSSMNEARNAINSALDEINDALGEINSALDEVNEMRKTFRASGKESAK